MNKIFYTFVLSALVLLSVQCNPKSQESDEQLENDSIIEYAELLSITCHDDYTDVKISNPWDSARLLHRYILVPKTQNVPSNLPQGTVVRTPLSNTLVYASVHCSLLEQLDALSQIGGVCDLSYIKTPALLSRAENGKLTDAGNSMSPDIERVMSLNPDAILLSPFENAGYGRIGKMGIPIIECADYLETSPLGRAEWIKFFGLLYGKEVEADSIFTEVEKNYTELRDKIGVLSSAPVVISELKSGSAWYMPGGKSYMDYTDNGFGVNLLQEKRKAAFFTSDDAIGCVNDSLFYIYKPKENQEWLLSQERAIEKGGNIDNPAVCQELREYAFSMLQTAQYLMSNNLTGKYIGYQPR